MTKSISPYVERFLTNRSQLFFSIEAPQYYYGRDCYSYLLFVYMTLKTFSSSLHSLSRLLTRHTYLIKRSVTTTMASSNEDSSKTKAPPKKQDNLLAKRYIGLEKNIWLGI